MSNLADKTEYRALCIIARMVMKFERLHCLDMTATDDWDATGQKYILCWSTNLSLIGSLKVVL